MPTPRNREALTRLPTDVDRALGQRMRELRQAAGLSQAALGTRLGLTYQRIQKYEKGTSRLAFSRLGPTAEALGVTVAVLLGEAAPPPAALIHD
jgi:transcriptional regulator with XRE-family HTH domain